MFVRSPSSVRTNVNLIFAFTRHLHFSLALTTRAWGMRSKGREIDSSDRDKFLTTSKYTYTPLSDNTNHVRLLHLLPASSPWAPLHCTLTSTPLSLSPPYTALSYTWGERSGYSHVHINNAHILIAPNLKHALQRLRRPDTAIVLWVDALCINQEDIPERSAQTMGMRNVYLRAERVAVWLGLEHSSSLQAVQLVREINATKNLQELRTIVLDPEKRFWFEALKGLFRRQYWWRIWVIQEMACAKQATVYIGSEELSWEELDGACDILRSVQDTLQEVFYETPSYIHTFIHGGPRSLQLSRYSAQRTPSGPAGPKLRLEAPPLIELLLTHKSKNATDPKDKVFALVGISASRDSFGMIDYSQSVAQVYTHTTRHIINSTRKLDVICVNHHDYESKFGLPSWVTDWKRQRLKVKEGRGRTVVGLHHRLPLFRAAGHTEADVQFLVSGPKSEDGSESGNVLCTKGVILGRITSLGVPYRAQGAPSDIEPALQVFNNWWNVYVSSLSLRFPNQDADPERLSIGEKARFGRIISCYNWFNLAFESSNMDPEAMEIDDESDNERYAAKVDSIFNLPEQSSVPRSTTTFVSRNKFPPFTRPEHAVTISPPTSAMNFNLEHLDPPSRVSTISSLASSTHSLLSDEHDNENDNENEDHAPPFSSNSEDKFSIAAMISASMMMNRRRFFVCAAPKDYAGSEEQIMGLAPWNAKIGDAVVVLYGCRFPVVIRREVTPAHGKVGNSDTLIGESYVDGFMHGEALAELSRGRFEVGQFEIC